MKTSCAIAPCVVIDDDIIRPDFAQFVQNEPRLPQPVTSPTFLFQNETVFVPESCLFQLGLGNMFGAVETDIQC
ncbi:hypothetical protein DWB67_14145 [Paracoccus sp. JM45]|nr:hypothetical protein DWB67_14145 [Paracoccus sp. JM45]